MRGIYALIADKPDGEFNLRSDGALTLNEWECLDRTLYVNKSGVPCLVFCHKHTQIIDGTICYIQLSDDLKQSVGEAKYIFSGSSPYFVKKIEEKTLCYEWTVYVPHKKRSVYKTFYMIFG